MTAPRKPRMYVDDAGRINVVVEEETLFGQITIALVNAWSEDGLRLMTNYLDVTDVFWRESTLETRSRVIGQLVDMLWLKAAQERLMLVAIGRPRWGAFSVEMPAHMLPVVTERTPFPSDGRRATISLRAYAMSPAITDLNM